MWLGVDGFVFDGETEALNGLGEGEGGGEGWGEVDCIGDGLRTGDWEFDLDLT
jgi:hypothetical protein